MLENGMMDHTWHFVRQMGELTQPRFEIFMYILTFEVVDLY